MEAIPIGANGLLYTPYLVGERTPHADSSIRGSLIGMDGAHNRKHFLRAIMEGITFSLHESIELFREARKSVHTVVSIGGGAKNDTWLQMQADIFNTRVIKLENEQGPAMGLQCWLPLEAVGLNHLKNVQSSSFVRLLHFIQRRKMFKNIKHYLICIRTFTLTQRISIQL